MEYTLNIGDVVTSPRIANYTCKGLGSCIGLFIQDRATGASGGAHIFLPESEVSLSVFSKFYNVNSALDEILNQFRSYGSSLQALRAKVTGGANVVGLQTDMGERNARSVVRSLIERRIFIAATDLGGNVSRTVRFESETGKLTVRKAEIKEVMIL